MRRKLLMTPILLVALGFLALGPAGCIVTGRGDRCCPRRCDEPCGTRVNALGLLAGLAVIAALADCD